MNLWMQVYNLQSDDKTKKPSAKIEYDIVNVAQQSRCCTPRSPPTPWEMWATR